MHFKFRYIKQSHKIAFEIFTAVKYILFMTATSKTSFCNLVLDFKKECMMMSKACTLVNFSYYILKILLQCSYTYFFGKDLTITQFSSPNRNQF